MPIDTHARVAAWLHIAMGALAVSLLALFGLLFGAFGALGVTEGGIHAGIFGWLAGLGAVILLVVMAFPALEILGGVLLLQGNPAGRVITIVFSVLGLINIPFGTVVGVYSLWALLRDVPRAADAVPAQPGNIAPY